MSTRDVDTVVAMYEAFNRGDIAAARDALHPQAELHQPPNIADADSYFGLEGFVKGLTRWTSAWDEARFVPLGAEAVGDRVLLHIRVTGKGRESGARTEMEFFHLWSLRAGKPFRCVVRVTREEALALAQTDE